MGKKGNGWFSTVKKVFKHSSKDLPEKKVSPLYIYICMYSHTHSTCKYCILQIICLANSGEKNKVEIDHFKRITYLSGNITLQQ